MIQLNKNVIIIGGATATGKSRLALSLASAILDRFGIESEIINADSLQIYNEFKILTCQPTVADMQVVPHRLYSILSPHEENNVFEWNMRAQAEIQRILSERKVAIIVGGTGFYINSMCYGLPTAPKVPQEIREKARTLLEELGKENFYRNLVLLDNKIETVIKKKDTHRLLRAYEVFMFTKKSIVDFQQKQTQEEEPNNVLKIFLNPGRSSVIRNIESRTLSMLKAGVIDEVKDYYIKYGDLQTNITKAIGYKELLDHVQSKMSLIDAIEKMNISSRQYAKRQVTWFKNKMKNAICLQSTDNLEIIIDGMQS